MVGGYHGDGDALGARDLNSLVELEWHDPFRIGPQLIFDKVSRDFATVNRAMRPVRCQANIMITVKMTEKICIAPLDGAVAEGIDAYEESGHDLIKGAGPLIRWLSARGMLGSGG